MITFRRPTTRGPSVHDDEHGRTDRLGRSATRSDAGDHRAAVAFVLAYLIGSVDFAVLVARARGGDIYQMGSGNPGAANVLRNLGWRAALPVMLGDMAKGAAPPPSGRLGGSDAAGWAAGFAAVVGHCFPVWHRFRGGKGVATAFGVALWMEPLLGLVLVAVWAGLLAVTKVSSIGSLVAMPRPRPRAGPSPGGHLAGDGLGGGDRPARRRAPSGEHPQPDRPPRKPDLIRHAGDAIR